MSDLSNSINHYYLSHFDALPLDKQVHFASRMYAWTGEHQYRELLDRLRPTIIPDNDAHRALERIRDGVLFPHSDGNRSMLAARQPYFDRYPELRAYARILYWAHLISSMYGLDCTDAVAVIVPRDIADKLYDELSVDSEAIAILSTFAINYLYLYQHYVSKKPAPEPSHFLDLARDAYDMSVPIDRQQCSYLLTHCVINDSLFYTQPVTAQHRKAHAANLTWLEAQIAPYITEMKLDNVYEFLVSCALVGKDSHFENMLSIQPTMSPDDGFIIDPHSSYQSFANSEHRNVLYIMASTQPNI